MVELINNGRQIDFDVYFHSAKVPKMGENYSVEKCIWKDIYEGTPYCEDWGQVRTREIADVVYDGRSLGSLREVPGIKKEHTKLEFVPNTGEVKYYDTARFSYSKDGLIRATTIELNPNKNLGELRLYSSDKKFIGSLMLHKKDSEHNTQ